MFVRASAYLLSLLAAAALLAAMPLVVEVAVFSIAAWLPARRRPVVASLPSVAKLAVIVPAHNEARLIVPCVRSLRAAALNVPATAITIYVISHNSSDDTAARATSTGATALTLNEPIGGKGIALDYGFRHALAHGADAVLVIDADSIVSPNLLVAAAACFSQGAEALQCRYEVANATANRRTRLAALAFRGINVLRPLGRSRLGLSCGIFGNGFGLTAATIRRVPYVANSIVEDLEYHLNLIQAGVRVDFVNEAQVFGEMPTGSAAAGTQRARWEGGRALMRREWTWPLISQVLRGRLRLLEPLLDLRALPLASTAALLLLGGVLLGASLRLTTMPSATPWLLALDLLGVAAMLLYVLAAALLGPEPLATFAALASAPAYILWKILLIPQSRRAARADAAWVRTARNAEVATPQPTDKSA